MVSALVLAAGVSSRMGHPKLLLKLRGKPLICHVVESALASKAGEVVVVLGHKARTLKAELAPLLPGPTSPKPFPDGKGKPLRLVVNPHFQRGMSTSLQAGLNSLDPEAEAVLVLLGDQPMVSPEVMDALIEKYQETRAPIVAPYYAGERGNPVLFHRSLFPELATLTGDEGGRRVVAWHLDALAKVVFDNPSLSWDVDTWQDYLALCAAYEGDSTPASLDTMSSRHKKDG